MKKGIAVLLSVLMMAVVFTGCSEGGIGASIKTAEDLKSGLTIGCQSGTTGETWVKDNCDNAPKSYKTGMDAALDLKNGRLDAVILDELPAKAIVEQNSDLKILDIKFAKEEYAIAIAKDNTALQTQINAAIKKMKEDGTYDALSKAFMPADGNIVLPDEIATAGEPIKMATNPAFQPFEYLGDGNKIVGFDISMSQYIAKEMGRELEVLNMEFDSLIAALQSGNADFVAAGMSVTEERLKNVIFSDPYFASEQVIIVKK